MDAPQRTQKRKMRQASAMQRLQLPGRKRAFSEKEGEERCSGGYGSSEKGGLNS